MTHKSIVWITAVAAIGMAQAAAAAADLPVKMPVASAPRWTGFYVGANAGYGWHDPAVTFSTSDTFLDLGSTVGPGAPVAFSIAGALGGLQFGYNWQVNRTWLIGVETDFDFSGIKGNGTSANLAPAGPYPFASTADERVRWFGTVRGRLGYLPTENLLVYGTGGLAYGDVERNASYINNSTFIISRGNGICVRNTTCYMGSSTRLAAGWTVGGGAELAFAGNWTVKAEYLFVNLGNYTLTENVIFPAGSTSTMTAAFDAMAFHVVRAGLNYRF